MTLAERERHIAVTTWMIAIMTGFAAIVVVNVVSSERISLIQLVVYSVIILAFPLGFAALLLAERSSLRKNCDACVNESPTNVNGELPR